VAISLRDRLIPRRTFINKILKVAEQSGVSFQLEVESSGSSDAREINASAYPVDWCFIGAPEENVHSPREKVYKFDILSMLEMYQVLFDAL
jgi:putative aminopeptidase FrvX